MAPGRPLRERGRERLEADGLLFTLAMSGRLSHTGNAELRASVAGARAKLSKDEDSKLRIVKRSADRSIDAIVAASMAVKRCLDLNL